VDLRRQATLFLAENKKAESVLEATANQVRIGTDTQYSSQRIPQAAGANPSTLRHIEGLERK